MEQGSVTTEMQNEQWGCPLELLPALLLPNSSSISPEATVEKDIPRTSGQHHLVIVCWNELQRDNFSIKVSVPK